VELIGFSCRNLSDVNRDGMLDLDEFRIFCYFSHLLSSKKIKSLPATLPLGLLPNSSEFPNGDFYAGGFDAQGRYHGYGTKKKKNSSLTSS
jgi:hypothetical protein